MIKKKKAIAIILSLCLILSGMVPGTMPGITVRAEGEATEYSVSIDSALQGGEIITSQSSAVSGSAITLTITPGEGKQLRAGSLTYSVDDGANFIPIQNEGFVMPGANVTIYAVFEDEPTSTKLSHDVTQNEKTFKELGAGYTEADRETLTVRVTAAGANNNVVATLSGTNASDFTIVNNLVNLADAESGTLTVVANTGLAVGTYNATVTITSTEFPAGVTFSVTQVVNGPGVLAFSDATYTVDESAGNVTVTVNRTGGTLGAVEVHYATSFYTAANVNDYTDTQGILHFNAGETTQSFEVQIIDDENYENNEYFKLTLSDPTGGATLGTQSTSKVTILDEDTAKVGTFQFSSDSYTFAEGTTNIIKIERVEGTDKDVTVQITSTSEGATATSGDYEPINSIVEFKSGNSEKDITIKINADEFADQGETIKLKMQITSGYGAVLGQSTATITITDSQLLQFGSSTYSVAENANSITIPVKRMGVITGKVTVDYYPYTYASWIDESDFTCATGTLTFNEGETEKYITISILDDSSYEGDEKVRIFLKNPSSGSTLSSGLYTDITITDNDPAKFGEFSFSSPTYTKGENGGPAKITVNRTNGSDGSVSVNYSTGNGTAMAGSDYITSSGTLTFSKGEITKDFYISSKDDLIYEGNETVNLTLSDPTGGGALGSQPTSVLTITDNELPSTNAQLTSVAGQLGVTEGGDGSTITTPITWSVNLSNIKETLGIADIIAANYATKNLYSDSNFSTEVSEGSSIDLDQNGITTVYIRVTAQDTTTVRYYKVRIIGAVEAGMAAINSNKATLSDYLNVGIIGVTADNLDAVKDAVLAANTVKGSELTKDEIQAAVSVVVINEGNGSLQNYTDAGITDVTNDNLEAINEAVSVAKETKGSNLTKNEIQTEVTVLNINLGTGEVENYTDAGITGVTAGNLEAINDAVSVAKEAKGSNLTKNELQTIVENTITTVAVAVINQGTANLSNYTDAGITGVTEDNLKTVNDAVVAAKALKGSNLTKDELQTAVQTAVKKVLATEKINAGIDEGNVTLQDYIDAGITGVTQVNLTTVNTAVAAAKALKGSDLTKEEIQAVVSTPHYSISLSSSAEVSFTATEGYSQLPSRDVRINNSGTGATEILKVTLSGTDSDKFTLSKSSINSINVNNWDTLSITPITGLSSGTYTASVTVSGGNVTQPQSFDVSFIVKDAAPTTIKMSSKYTNTTNTIEIPEQNQGYAWSSTVFALQNTGTNPALNLTLTLSGANASDFKLDVKKISSLGGNDTSNDTSYIFLIANTGLTTGTYTAVLTVSGSNFDTVSLPVSFTVRPEYKMEIKIDPDQDSDSDIIIEPVHEGYNSIPGASITLTNIGARDLTVSSALTGKNSNSFTLLHTINASVMRTNDINSYKVMPNFNLKAGIYQTILEITVKDHPEMSRSIAISFTVTSDDIYAAIVNNGTGDGDYAAGATVNITADAAASGKEFDQWTGSNGVTFVNATATSTSFTMPTGSVNVTATYKNSSTSNGGTSNDGTSNGGTSNGGTSNGGTSNGGGSGTTITDTKSITVVEAPKSIPNSDKITVEPIGEAFDQSIEVRLKDDKATETTVRTAMEVASSELDSKNTQIFPLDISLYIKGTDTKVQPAQGTEVKIACPIPTELLTQKDKLVVVCVINNKLQILPTTLITKDGVSCVEFIATHFSPYAFVLDTEGKLADLAAGNTATDPSNSIKVATKITASAGTLTKSIIENLPQNATVAYHVCTPAYISINSKGEIFAKKPGKAILMAAITVDKTTTVHTITITVKKAKAATKVGFIQYYDDLITYKNINYRITLKANKTAAGTVAVGNNQLNEKLSTKVVIPSKITLDGKTYNVTSIDESAFYNVNSIKSVSIPYTVKSISETAFTSCDKLKTFIVESGNLNYTAKKGMLLDKTGTRLIAYPSASGKVVLDSKITTIGAYAFSACKDLSGIIIPKTVKRIEGCAFANSKLLSKVTFQSVTVPEIPFLCIFDGINQGCVILVPDKAISLYQTAFENARQPKSIVIMKK